MEQNPSVNYKTPWEELRRYIHPVLQTAKNDYAPTVHDKYI
jgi:hypothetical protein